MQTTTLNNIVTLPMLGLGVFQDAPNATAAAVQEALPCMHKRLPR